MGSQEFNTDAFRELIELEEAGSDGLISDLIGDFLETSVALRDAILASAGTTDLKVLERSAHSLKSSSRLLGLDRLADVAYVVEDGARHGTIRMDEIQTIPVYLDAGHVNLRAYRDVRRAA